MPNVDIYTEQVENYPETQRTSIDLSRFGISEAILGETAVELTDLASYLDNNDLHPRVEIFLAKERKTKQELTNTFRMTAAEHLTDVREILDFYVND